ALQARLHQGDGGLFLWLVNPTHKPQQTSFALAPGFGAVKATASLWPEKAAAPAGSTLTVPARDAVVLQLG
ncbi:MAG TPA: hypothetical protein VL418_00540, partial [Devosiaceae bacterium]|nr:hypothetical protein [Devosiaceae bacterium]